ncbi:hypothetical protein [Limnoglobus roseus]|uniref:VRR-NUC domain-containing protein n=1 Tax=Limnoglobus roseus TaxID=2598579 RepID=A0A5C1A982_9BACT|nr:hypothetical protein [Limnoglobus roseus]QEL14763.1 hypothetical protein PX52LOC_01657 [Limnoglobus roseus]
MNACIRWLYLHGMQPIRNNTGGFSKSYTDKVGHTKTHHVSVGRKGSGDILACTPSGMWLEIECKNEDGKQSLDQIERQKHIEAMGGLYILARSIDDLEARKVDIIVPGRRP